MGKILIRFGIHCKQVKVYIIVNGQRKSRVTSFFGSQYCISTSVEYWNRKEGKFFLSIGNNAVIPTASDDNRKLSELKDTLEEFAGARDFSDCDDFLSCYKRLIEAGSHEAPTLLEYTQTFAQLWKDNRVMGKCYKYKSGNYIIYEKLARRLQGYQYKTLQPWASEIQRFANMSIAEIGNAEYNDFLYFLYSHNIPVKDSLNAFRAAVYYYRHWIMEDDGFKLHLKEKYKRILKDSKKKKRQSITLSQEQLSQISSLDIECFPSKASKGQLQLYKDALLLMYGLVTRPFDILSMKIEDIKERKGGMHYWVYCANKLRNTKGKKDETPIQPGCWSILSKYIAGRKRGFVLPFAINSIEKPHQQRRIQVNHLATKIGNFLKAMARHYGWDLDADRLTMYTMRHTAITDLLKYYNCNIVAVWAHTSVKEINDTYEDRQNLATSIFPDNFSLIE